MSLKSERILLPENVVPKHYELVLSPSLETLDFTCDMEVHVDVLEPVTTITMHSKEIVIETATIEGQSATDISYEEKDTTVTLTFANTITVGNGKVLKVSYKGILNGDMAGFYKSSYSNADGKKVTMASTQFEALDARRAFPCWDEPAVKATFKVSMIVDKKLQALSNMPEIGITNLPGDLVRYDFDVSPIMSTYLLAWAIGEFDMVQGYTTSGVSIRIFCPPGRAPQGYFALDAGKRALEFYNEFFGVKYPLPKLDMLCVTEFAAGAMENWGLVTYREVDLMIDAEKASSQQRQRVAIVVAHELAHQWFGNLVTMEWWDGIWLNEGFAAFMEHFCVDSLYPEYKIWEQYTTDAFGAAQRLDALRSSHPVIVPIKAAEEVEQVFDAISYCKGSTCVRAVQHVIGLDAFRTGLQTYFKKYQFSNANTDQLWAEWSAASGTDVGALMNTWTKTMGHPYVKVITEKWSSDSVEIELEQNWFLADGSAKPDEMPLWSIPLQFATPYGIYPNKPEIMSNKRHTFKIPFQESNDRNWVKINADQKFLVRCAHSPEMARRLQPALQSGVLSAVDRAAVLLDSYALAKAGLGSIDSVVTILMALENEASTVVFNSCAGVLNGLLLLTENISVECHTSFRKLGKRIVMNALSKCGWDPKANDQHSEKLFRSTCIGLLDAFASDEPTVFNEAKRRFDGHFSDSSILPADYKTTVYKILLKSGDIEEYEAILKTFTDTDDNSLRKYAMNSLGASKSSSLKLRTLDWAVKSGDVKLQDFFYPIGSVTGDGDGAELAWQYFQDNFEYIKEKLAKANSSLMDAVITFTCNRFCTHDKANEIELFFEKNSMPSNVRRISQLLENMRTSATFLDRIKESNFEKLISSC
jgi:puromycin-sensitive aminopeptidase